MEVKMAAMSQANSCIMVEERAMKVFLVMAELMNRKVAKRNTPSRAMTIPFRSTSHSDCPIRPFMRPLFTMMVETSVAISRINSSMKE